MHDSAKVARILQLLQKNNEKQPHLAESLEMQQDRFERFSRRFDGLLIDYSRTALDEESFATLVRLAEAAGVGGMRNRLFGGQAINESEDRPVLHHLWRSRAFEALLSRQEAKTCRAGLGRMQAIAGALNAGHLPGDPGQVIRDVIHVGIGGSLLGPRLVCDAFPSRGRTPSVHFISSVDALDRERLLARLDPDTTVIVLVSKSFTTNEVLAHGQRLLSWQNARLNPDAAAQRRFAVSAHSGRAIDFGVPPDGVLPMGEWTGGRFSLWSPVGLTAAVVMGPDAFDAMCSGGAAMDRHFQEAPPEQNLPLIHGLVSCWFRNVQRLRCRALVPYDTRLKGLAAWAQQVQMESNGKSVTRSGHPVAVDTAAVVFGECGTDAQHSLFQALHQGTEVVPVDFIGVVNPEHSDQAAQTMLLSHMLAQATALAQGRNAGDIRAALQARGLSADRIDSMLPHRRMPGNRPSIVFLLDRLDPATLGALLVLYEHSVFVQSVVWDINAFDQWGVELGKELCDRIAPVLPGDRPAASGVESLAGLIREIRLRSTG